MEVKQNNDKEKGKLQRHVSLVAFVQKVRSYPNEEQRLFIYIRIEIVGIDRDGKAVMRVCGISLSIVSISSLN